MDNMNLKTESQSKKYESLYGNHIEVAAASMLKKFKYEWTANDTVAFGQQADTWMSYKDIFESEITTVASLGPAVQAGLGLVAMTYSALPIQNLASVQPLSDEAGTIYLRKGIAANSHGGVTAGDQLVSPFGAVNKKIGEFTSETQVSTKSFVANTDTYAFTLGQSLRPGAIRISVAGGKIKGMDDGEGHILGVGIDSETSVVNYTTGVATIKLVDAEGKGVVANDTVDVTYASSLIDSGNIPTMKWMLDSKVVKSDYYLLQSQYSNISEMVLRKRLGSDLANQVSADLVSQITGAVMYKAIKKLRDAAIRNEVSTGTTITFATAAAAGISDFSHRRTFTDKVAEAVGVMYQIAGKGDATSYIVGLQGKQILLSCGMEVIKNSVSGPHLCGMYQGTPVYYAPNTVLGNNEMLVVYRGNDWYESPLVYAPFLPVTTVSGNSVGNVMVNAQAVYHAAAIESTVDGFCVKINFV